MVRRVMGVLAVVALLIMVPAGTTLAQDADDTNGDGGVNFDDFLDDYAGALASVQAGDPYDLDGNDDGEFCEGQFGGGSGGSTSPDATTEDPPAGEAETEELPAPVDVGTATYCVYTWSHMSEYNFGPRQMSPEEAYDLEQVFHADVYEANADGTCPPYEEAVPYSVGYGGAAEAPTAVIPMAEAEAGADPETIYCVFVDEGGGIGYLDSVVVPESSLPALEAAYPFVTKLLHGSCRTGRYRLADGGGLVSAESTEDGAVDVPSQSDVDEIVVGPIAADEGSGDDANGPAVIAALAPSDDDTDGATRSAAEPVETSNPATVRNPVTVSESGAPSSPSDVGASGRRNTKVVRLPSTGSGFTEEASDMPIALVGLGLAVMAGASYRLGRPRA